MVWTDEQIKKLKTLWNEGLTASEIARLLGKDISRNAVIGKALRIGLKARPYAPTKDEIDDLMFFALDGVEQLTRIHSDILLRGSNKPLYPPRVLKALTDLKAAFETFLKDLGNFEDYLPDRSQMRSIGNLLGSNIKDSFIIGAEKLKKEAGYISLVGSIGYLLTLTGNPEMATVVVAMLLGKDIEKK